MFWSSWLPADLGTHSGFHSLQMHRSDIKSRHNSVCFFFYCIRFTLLPFHSLTILIRLILSLPLLLFVRCKNSYLHCLRQLNCIHFCIDMCTTIENSILCCQSVQCDVFPSLPFFIFERKTHFDIVMLSRMDQPFKQEPNVYECCARWQFIYLCHSKLLLLISFQFVFRFLCIIS